MIFNVWNALCKGPILIYLIFIYVKVFKFKDCMIENIDFSSSCGKLTELWKAKLSKQYFRL